MYFEPSGFWDYQTAPYLLSSYTDEKDLTMVYTAQKNRVYDDELEYFNNGGKLWINQNKKTLAK